ncbi:MAG: CPBP family intramembrane metalloprotease [Bdellovibrionales bacterium]|nr:CPBP family intramembrane metalloprotease [Bdellovibrionales bacterium]
MSNQRHSSLMHKFLGSARWEKLFSALRTESETTCEPPVGTLALVAALAIAVTPVVLTLLQHVSPSTSVDLPTLSFAVCTVMAILMRRWLKLDYRPTVKWKESLSLTHTAFALGCLPAAILIALNPTMFAERHDILTTAVPLEPTTDTNPILFAIHAGGVVVFLAAWAAVTEEFLFRGLLVSVIRRWSFISSQRTKDAIAALSSATIFGIAHYPTWGLTAALALGCIGSGFVIGYIANGERLTPLIFYHFCFDTLSILVIFML